MNVRDLGVRMRARAGVREGDEAYESDNGAFGGELRGGEELPDEAVDALVVRVCRATARIGRRERLVLQENSSHT